MIKFFKRLPLLLTALVILGLGMALCYMGFMAMNGSEFYWGDGRRSGLFQAATDGLAAAFGLFNTGLIVIGLAVFTIWLSLYAYHRKLWIAEREAALAQ